MARVRNLPRWLRRNNTSGFDSASLASADIADFFPPDPDRPTTRASRLGALGRSTEIMFVGGAVSEEGRRRSTLLAPFGGFVDEAAGVSAADIPGRSNNNNERVVNVEMTGSRRGGRQMSPGGERNMSTE